MTTLAEPVSEYYDSGNAPHEALGRAARRLSSGGALYLGGGVGIEKQTTKDGDRYNLTRATGAKAAGESFTGPLSAVIRAFGLAGSSTAPDTPGGATKVTDPAAAARLRELKDDLRRIEQDIERYQARLAAKVSSPNAIGIPSPAAVSDDQWEARRLAELRREKKQVETERDALLSSGKVVEGITAIVERHADLWDVLIAEDALAVMGGGAPLNESAQTAALSVTHAPIGKGGKNWITKSKPGNTGQLPAYIQNVRNAIMRDGKDESSATAIAISRVRKWKAGLGNVGAEVQAAAAKAIAEFEAMRAKNKAK